MDSDSNQVMVSSEPSVGQGGLTQGQVQVSAQPTGTAVTVQTQDDGDSSAIDQEWVNMAKDIVERTKSDPFVQSNELSKIKAGYLKARYNKQLNIGEERMQ